MLVWETVDQDPKASDVMLEFARIYKELPKLVFSTTLDSVIGNATLETGDPGPVVKRLKQEPGKDLAVGGAGLASTLMKLDLIDEYLVFIAPVILGGGTPYLRRPRSPPRARAPRDAHLRLTRDLRALPPRLTARTGRRFECAKASSARASAQRGQREGGCRDRRHRSRRPGPAKRTALISTPVRRIAITRSARARTKC